MAARQWTKTLKPLSFVIILLIVNILFIPATQATGDEDNGWGQYGHDAQHTWRADSVGPTSNVQILWKEKVYSSYDENNDILAYGNYIITKSWKYINIFNANTLYKIRNITLNDAICYLAVYKGVLYTAHYDNITAYNFDGKVLWNVGNIRWPYVILVSEYGVFVLSGEMYSQSAKIYWISLSGEIKSVWNASNISTLPVVYRDRLYFAVCYCANYNEENVRYQIRVVNLTTNTTTMLSGFEKGAADIEMEMDDNGTLYVAFYYLFSSKKMVYAISSDGHIKWIFHYKSLELGKREHMVIGKSMVYIFAYVFSSFHVSPSVICINKDNGKMVKYFSLSSSDLGFSHPLVDSRGDFYFLAESTLYSYSLNGRLNWKIKIGGIRDNPWIFNTMFLIFKGYIYLLTAYGYLYKIGTPSPIPVVVISTFIGGLIILGVWRWRKSHKTEKLPKFPLGDR